MKYIYSVGFILLLSFSCQKKYDPLEEALQMAGDNRAELEKVLSYYKKDSLKYRAACFLIENMPYHSFYDEAELEKYLKYYKCCSEREKEIVQIIDSLVNVDGILSLTDMEKKNDIQNINSEYLTDNIDWAFKVWREQPWFKNVDFNTFCEYILPYRVGNEKPAYWRKHLYEICNPLLDSIRSLPECADPLFAATFLMDTLSKINIILTNKLPVGPNVGPDIVHWRVGACRELCDIAAYSLRSVGIPCSIDYMTRGDNNAVHSWNVLIAKDRNEYMINFPYTTFIPTEELADRKGKVFRHTFSLNREEMKRINTKPAAVHPSFRYPLFVDVTAAYAGRWSRNLVLSKNILYDKNATWDIVYLCTSRWLEWLPISLTKADRDSLRFTDVEGNNVFQLATWDSSGLHPVSDPFLFEKETGNIRYFHSSAHQDTVHLYCKFPLHNERYIYNMLHGVFEGSNDPYFLKADTLYLIDNLPVRRYTAICIDSNKKYRFVRYKGGKESYCNVAEVEFYETENLSVPLKGRVIGTPGCLSGDGSHEYANAFDGDPYTSFEYKHPSSGWTGLALGAPKSIGKIRYVPRNYDNFIRQGDTYELFYWQNRQWNSAGKQQAHSDSLYYTAPQNSLLYLKNHTRGKEERIFEYRDGRQIFW
ncbi:MAG: hypothetical protein LBH32_04520 [Dysgonamonadaceae bacterium]|nr:hypothetical protein [Dysgonamonadaceae bacterium]